jgi:hypothetical protein
MRKTWEKTKKTKTKTKAEHKIYKDEKHGISI